MVVMVRTEASIWLHNEHQERAGVSHLVRLTDPHALPRLLQPIIVSEANECSTRQRSLETHAQSAKVLLRLNC